MPELPEVETVVRGLRRARLVNRRILDTSIHWPRIVAKPALPEFRARLRGQTIRAITRRAKYIVITLSSGDTVFIHLRMTGALHFHPLGAPRDAHEHVVLTLDDQRELRYRDPRKFGRWTLISDPSSVIGDLGPEPLAASFTMAVLASRLRGRARALKPLLLDQTIVAGLGNIYVDEALWDANLHPLRRGNSLTRPELTRLHAAIGTVLRRGIRAQGTTLGKGSTNFYSVAGRRGRNQDGLKIFRRTGDPCPRCRTPITRIIVAQRSTHLCPKCQRA